MKKTCLAILVTTSVAFCAAYAISSDASVEKGKMLFNDPGLAGSTNSRSCGGCHPDGKGLAGAGDSDSLAKMINTCIERPLKGQPLDENSSEMESLKLYIKSLK